MNAAVLIVLAVAVLAATILVVACVAGSVLLDRREHEPATARPGPPTRHPPIGHASRSNAQLWTNTRCHTRAERRGLPCPEASSNSRPSGEGRFRGNVPNPSTRLLGQLLIAPHPANSGSDYFRGK